MAKKKTEEVEFDRVDFVAKAIEKEYGDGIIVSGEDFISQPKARIPWSPAIDNAMSGPIEEGSWVGVTGPEKVGKTTSCLSFAANAQKPEYGGRPVFYGMIEGRLSPEHTRGIAGLNGGKGKFEVLRSTQGKILCAQDWLTIFSNVLKNVPRVVLILDSISALVDERELVGGVGTETRGGGAKLFSQFLRNMNQVVPTNNAIVFGITHRISNTSGFGSPVVEKGPVAWKYQKDYSLRAVSKKNVVSSSGRTLGLEVEWLCETSKNGPPGAKFTGHIRFGTGLDAVRETLKLGETLGFVQKKGSWCVLDFLDDKPQFQGDERACLALRQNPAWLSSLGELVSCKPAEECE